MKNFYTNLCRAGLFIFFFCLSLSGFSQEFLLKGTVTNPSQEPLMGVNVINKERSRGTITQVDGTYELQAQKGDTLLFTYLGYQSVKKIIAQEQVLNVQLQAEENTLDATIINAGYYNTTERERTGSISKVSGKELELQPLISPLQALQGRMAGVEIIPEGNLPGAAPTIRIRGTNSLREEGNLPLYIIDGVPINSTPVESNSNLQFTGIDPLSTLNLSNIESIEVLKDADATAIYGSRGANGVILITTKKGKGQKGVQARIYTGVSTVPNRIDLLSTKQYIEIRKKAFENDGVEPTESNAYDLLIWDQERETDWQEEFLGGNAQVTDVNVSASGGDEHTSYRLSGSYQKQGTVYPGDSNYQKATSGFSLNHSSKDQKLSLNLTANYGLDVNKLVGNSSLISQLYNLAPNAPPIFNEDGTLYWEEWTETGIDNPFQGYSNTSKTQSNNLISNLNINYELLKDFSFKTNVGYTYFNSSELIKRPNTSYNPLYREFIDNESGHLKTTRKSWIIEPQLTYRTHIGDIQLDALLGTSFQQSRNGQLGLTGTGYVSEALIGNLAAAETLSRGSNSTTDYRYHAIFGRLGMNLKKRYYLNLTGRRDGSSRFGPGKRFANFGAVGAAWIFSNENFIKNNQSFLSFGKIRASYGTTGNDQIGDYGYLDAYEATPGPGGLYPTALSNPDYSWETNKKLEAAVQLGFLKDRLNVNVNWYRNRSSNQLVGYPLPTITGFNSVQANLGATVENTGWEVEVSSVNIRKNNFYWKTSLNISFPKNELISYPNIDQSPYANTYRVGEPLNIALLYQYEGIDPETGFYSVTDINDDGRLDYEDRIVVKDRGRQYFGGINNAVTYRNFSLQFLWQFVKQEGTLALTDAGFTGSKRDVVYQALEEGSGFQNISTSFDALIAYNNAINSAFPYTDASFLRLKTLSLSYNIPTKLLQSIGIKAANIFLNGQNLLTFTPYEGMDPDIPNGTGTSFTNLRTITGGIQFNF